MNWTLLTIGKPRLAYARAGMEEYARRLRGVAQIRHEALKNSTRQAESALLLKRSEGMYRIVLDERGELLSSRAFAGRVTAWENGGVRNVALLVGGSDGHTGELRAAADWCWSLSPLTLQHELALVVLYEQLYRAYAIKAGLPYHRD